jgi:hypothetical protein
MKKTLLLILSISLLSSCHKNRDIEPSNSFTKIKGQGDTVGNIGKQGDTVKPINDGSGN